MREHRTLYFTHYKQYTWYWRNK